MLSRNGKNPGLFPLEGEMPPSRGGRRGGERGCPSSPAAMLRSRRFAARCQALAMLLCVAICLGCSSVPRRNPDQAIPPGTTNSPLPPPASTPPPAAIDSEYMSLARRAFEQTPSGKSNHFVQLLEIGDDALLARLHLIRAARETIDIQTFIWREDAVTRVLFDELVQAARRGVRVRLLVDAFIPMGPPGTIARMATAHEQVQICLYNPASNAARRNPLHAIESFVFRLRRINRRMHNKAFVVDGSIAILGGRNYDRRYFDRHDTFLYKDREIVVIGPVAREVKDSFHAFWEHEKAVFAMQFPDVRRAHADDPGRPPAEASAQDREIIGEVYTLASLYAPSKKRPAMAFHPVRDITFVADAPITLSRNNHNRMTSAYRQLARQARERLVFQTPYLIYDRRTRRDFEYLRNKNPDFRIVVSGNSFASADHIHVHAISYKHRKRLFRAKQLDIYEMKPLPGDVLCFVPRYPELGPLPPERLKELIHSNPAGVVGQFGPRLCIHGKTLVVDGQSVLIGSHNFDPRSASLNSECGVIIHDPHFASLVERIILRDTLPRNSWVVGRKRSEENLLVRLNRLFGTLSMALPFFDIWPYAYTSVFELNDEGTPLPPRHPDFHDNYHDVGQFPKVDAPTRILLLQFYKAFGGWARSLM